MRAVVEGLNPATPAPALRVADSWLRTALASTLPSSTPHWSKEHTFHTKPSTDVRCSYRASSCPVVYASSRGSSRESEGRLPGKTWGSNVDREGEEGRWQGE